VTCNVTGHNPATIKSFLHKGIQDFFETGGKAGIRPDHAKRLQRQLFSLNQSGTPEDMRFPGWNPYPLSHDLAGHRAVTVNGNWWLTFAFAGEDAILVDYQDYHQRRFTMTQMFNPPHPAEVIREDVLPSLGLTVTEAAKQLGVSRAALSRILNERAGISAEMAIRLTAWLKTPDGGGPSAESFLLGQARYDLWQAEHKQKPLAVPAARESALKEAKSDVSTRKIEPK
jgi:proteic killer suppression protein